MYTLCFLSLSLNLPPIALVLDAAPSLQGAAAALPPQPFSDVEELSGLGHVPQSSALVNLALHLLLLAFNISSSSS